MNVLGIGIDSEEHNRFDSKNLDLAKKILSEEEIETYLKIKGEKRKKEFLSSRFSLKEALFKCGVKKKMTEITIYKDEDKKPYIDLKDGYKYEVSLTHNNSLSIAVVIKLEI